MPDKTKNGFQYESEDDDGDDPCPYCGHDPCWCSDYEEDDDDDDKEEDEDD